GPNRTALRRGRRLHARGLPDGVWQGGGPRRVRRGVFAHPYRDPLHGRRADGEGRCRVRADPLGGHGHRCGHRSERARGEPGAFHFRAATGRLEDRSLHVQQGIMTKRIRIGIIGANPDRGWAAQAHIPALKSLPDDFEITALSTSRRESADAARERFGVPLAFDNHKDLVNSADVDVVAITVKVPHHLELATAALDAGKAVYCEWPLGNGLQEAVSLAALAKKKGVLAVAGLQARSAPAVSYVRDLIRNGYVGEVLSTTLIASGMGWGPTVNLYNAYLNDKKNGATMLSIALGHAADALCYCLGEVRELSATMALRRKSFTIVETGESK